MEWKFLKKLKDGSSIEMATSVKATADQMRSDRRYTEITEGARKAPVTEPETPAGDAAPEQKKGGKKGRRDAAPEGDE